MHDTALGWRLINPRMAERYSTEAMGETAENVAERYGISREDQDAFALRSHQRAVAAQTEGRFADADGRASRRRPASAARRSRVDADEGPRADTTLEKLAGAATPRSARAARVTAGNASTLNDGAACVVLASEAQGRRARRRAARAHRRHRRRRRRSRASWESARCPRSAARSPPPGSSSTRST